MLRQRLRQRVDIQEKIAQQDPVTGAEVYTWKTIVIGGVKMSCVPAEVLTGPGKEGRAAGTTYAETSARINMRWFSGLHQQMRILWDSRVYDISGMETDISGRQEWRLVCVEGRADG